MDGQPANGTALNSRQVGGGQFTAAVSLACRSLAAGIFDSVERSHALRGNASRDAERHKLHCHAERGNDRAELEPSNATLTGDVYFSNVAA